MLNEKMLYQKAEAEVICFDNTDVITASGGGDECLWTPGAGDGGGGSIDICHCAMPHPGLGN